MNRSLHLPSILSTNASVLACLTFVLAAVVGCSCQPLPDTDLGPPAAPDSTPPADGNDGADSGDGSLDGDPLTPDSAPDGSDSGDDSPPIDAGVPCAACHKSPRGERRAIVDDSSASGHFGASIDGGCEGCHDFSRHRQGHVRLWTDPSERRLAFALDVGAQAAVQLAAFCGSCHRQAEYAGHEPSGPWQPTCIACHDVHDLDNPNHSALRTSVHNVTLSEDKPVRFTARSGPGSFSDGIGPHDGICEVCHTATRFHRHDGSGLPHQEGADCTACHMHAAGFRPAGAACVDCHRTEQGRRRAVVAEFSLASHHVHAAAVADSDCETCHDTGQHQSGTVRLRDIDDPGEVITLTGDPATDPAEAARLEPFCLACHDDDGAGGAIPFSDGRAPAPIDRDLWAAASHSAGQTTCAGDGATFGCHATGHGSARAHLLAGAAGLPPIPGDEAREEEGLCYTCHDADGPASTDVQAAFGLATRHNVSSLDQTDGSRVECTDCHDPHYANQGVPLIDPDSRTPWSGTGEQFCLACHDGDPPSSVAFPATAAGTGYDKSTFAGTPHEDHFGDDSCRWCHADHGSDHVSLLQAEYVVADYNPYQQGDRDFDICWQCHDEDATIRQVNAFDTWHETHVEDEDVTCAACHDVHAPHDAGERGLISFDFAFRAGWDIEYIDGRDASTSFWLDLPDNRGYCLIRCHGEDHPPEDYHRSELLCLVCHDPHGGD